MSYLFIFGVVICMVSFNTHACVHIASPTAKLQASSASINSEEASKPGDSSKCCSSLPSDTLETGVIRNVNNQKVKNKWQPQQQIWAQQNICVTLLSYAILRSTWFWKCRSAVVSIWFHHRDFGLPGVATSTLIEDTAFCSSAPGGRRKGTKDVSDNGSILQRCPKKCYRKDMDSVVWQVIIKISVSID